MGVDERGGFRLTGNIDTYRNLSSGEGSRVDFRAEVEVINPDAVHSFFTVLPGIATPVEAARRVEISPQNMEDVRDSIRVQSDRIGEALDIGGGQLRESAGLARQFINFTTQFNISGLGGGGQEEIPRPLRSQRSMRVNELPFEDQITVNFNPIPIPEIPGERFNVSSLPHLDFEFTLITNADVNPTTTADVIPEVIFNTVDITEDRECGEIFSPLFEDVEDLITQVQGAGQGQIQLRSIDDRLPLGQAREQLEDTADEVPIPNCRRELLSDLSGLNLDGCADITNFYSGINNRIDRLDTEIERLQGEPIDNIRDTIQNLRERGVNNAPGVQQIRQEIEDAGEQASNEEISCINQLESKLSEVESRISNLSAPTTSDLRDLDCGDIPGNLNSRANSFASDIRSRVRGGQFIRSQQANSLISEAESLKQQIQQRASNNNPCKSDLISTLNQVQNEIRQSEPEGCTDLYPSIDNSVDRLEASVVQLGAGVSASEIDQARSDVEEVLSNIENEIDIQDQECAERFSSRAQSVLNRLGQEVSTVRVIQAIGEEAAEQRQEEIEQLRGEIDRINREFQEIIRERRQEA